MKARWYHVILSSILCAVIAFLAVAEGQTQETASPDVIDDLIWAGFYEGLSDATHDDATAQAIVAYQHSLNAEATGSLTSEQRATLTRMAKEKRGKAGWIEMEDKQNGFRLGVPGKYVSIELPRDEMPVLKNVSSEFRVFMDMQPLSDPGMPRRIFDRIINAGGVTYHHFGDGHFVVVGEDGPDNVYRKYIFTEERFVGVRLNWPRAAAKTYRPLAIAVFNSLQVLGAKAARPHVAAVVPETTTATAAAPEKNGNHLAGYFREHVCGPLAASVFGEPELSGLKNVSKTDLQRLEDEATNSCQRCIVSSIDRDFSTTERRALANIVSASADGGNPDDTLGAAEKYRQVFIACYHEFIKSAQAALGPLVKY